MVKLCPVLVEFSAVRFCTDGFADAFSFFDADGPELSSWSSASKTKLIVEAISDLSTAIIK